MRIRCRIWMGLFAQRDSVCGTGSHCCSYQMLMDRRCLCFSSTNRMPELAKAGALTGGTAVWGSHINLKLCTVKMINGIAAPHKFSHMVRLVISV